MSTATVNPVHDWLTKPIPEKLWHYTSLQGLLGIVSSKHIFATDIRFLNDREEFVHAQSFIEEVIGGLDELDEHGWPVQMALKDVTGGLFARGVLSPKHSQVFVASFSIAEDQLSQWRAYSRGSTGVSLGFDLRNIRPVPGLGSLAVFSECIYDDDQKKNFIAHAIRGFVQGASEIWKQVSDKDQMNELLKEMMTKHPEWSLSRAQEELKKTQEEWIDIELKRLGALLARDLLQLGALQKHSSFKEEQEWRLVLPMMVNSVPKVHPRRFRPGATTLIPYVEFDLAEARPFPLTDVILGPGSEPQSAIEATRSFLASESLAITPRMSNAPFRAW